jgi:hypothetical protein
MLNLHSPATAWTSSKKNTDASNNTEKKATYFTPSKQVPYPTYRNGTQFSPTQCNPLTISQDVED